MAISAIEAPGILTRSVMEIYQDRLPVKPLFTGLAKERQSRSKLISYEVRRFKEHIAEDRERGTGSTRNSFNKSTVKLVMPAYYDESFDLLNLDIYDRPFGNEAVDPYFLADLTDQVADKAAILIDKINRAINLQHAQVFDNGIVQLKNGDNIDYKRKAASMVSKSGAAAWDQATATIVNDISDGCTFLRNVGKSASKEMVAIMGDTAFNAFLNSAEIKGADNRYVQRQSFQMPKELAGYNGASYHGTLSAKDYVVHVFTYPEIYDDATGTAQSYWDNKKVLLLPMAGYEFRTGFGSIEMLFKGNDTLPEYFRPERGSFFMNNYIDQRNRSHVFEILAAPLAIPYSVDQIYTLQVID